MSNARPLDENDSYVLFTEHEDVFLFDKDLNTEVWRTSMYGDATCGLLGLVNNWAVVGGENLVIWVDNQFKIIDDSDLRWVHDMRQIGDDEIEILIDPWSEKASLWSFNLKTLQKNKIRDFKDYRDKPYKDEVKWRTNK